MESELFLRKIIRETLNQEGILLIESLSDESIESLEAEMLKPWLAYYKTFATEGYNSMASVHRATFNTQLSLMQKIDVINGAFIKYMKNIQTLPSPNLNENRE